MIELYIILFIISALGITALILIVWGQQKPTPRTFAPPKLGDIETIENQTAPPKSLHTATASLGLNTFDIISANPTPDPIPTPPPVIEIPEPVAEPIIEKPKRQLLKDIFVFYLLAPKDRPFIGYELFQALIAAGFRYGDMNIFHRHEQLDENKPVLFSVASAVEPGIFDMTHIGAFSCPGLCLFMSAARAEDPAATFELMLETAQQLTEELEGQLCDDQRKPLTEEVVAGHRALLQL